MSTSTEIYNVSRLTQPGIDLGRLTSIKRLLPGAHYANAEGSMCAMEAVAWVAREQWSDHPRCACPVIGAFVRSWNDALPDDERTSLLLPLIPRLVGTRGSRALEERRALMAADWLVRVNTPAWLRAAGLTAHADVLAGLPEITSSAQVPSIRGPIEAAHADAAAVWNTARAAARAGADWNAVLATAVCAAAMGAAWNGAARGAVVWEAAMGAVRNAARVADRAKLQTTKTELQKSALALLDRMIAANDDDHREAA
jgi:hypothetical protein